MKKATVWCLSLSLVAGLAAPAAMAGPQSASRAHGKVAAQLEQTRQDLASQIKRTQALQARVQALQARQQADKQTLEQQDKTLDELRKQLAELKKTSSKQDGHGH